LTFKTQRRAVSNASVDNTVTELSLKQKPSLRQYLLTCLQINIFQVIRKLYIQSKSYL